MSSPLHHSPQSPQPEQTHQSDVVFQNPISQETLNQSGIETLPPSLDREVNNSPDEDQDDDDDEGEELEDEEDTSEIQSISSGMHLHVAPPIIDPHVSVHDVTLKSPSSNPNPRLGGTKRKKGKGKGKSNIKKQLAIEEKLQSLMLRLNPIPFVPLKILDFAKHEALLKKLGLWDFVHIDFDREIRADLVAQLIATYEVKSRASYVDGSRVMVNRADLARAFKFPVKKDKGNVSGMEMALDLEVLTEDSIGFIVEFVTDWLLLHDDTWMMPNEMVNWIKVIKDGHPERVDWAGLVWFMVEKELTQGAQLRDCYYASHLQYLIKSQRGELFLKEETVEFDEEAKVEDKVSEGDVNVNVGEAIEETGEERCLVVGPSTLLTLGQDGEKDEEIMDVEKCNESDEDGGDDEQGKWLLNGKKNIEEHYMQRCSAVDNGEFGSFEETKDEEDMQEEEMQEDVDEDQINVFPNDETLEPEGITGNLLQAMEDNQIAFSSEQDIIRSDIPPTSSFFNQMGKRVIDHDIDDDISHHALNDSNKRLRMNNLWDHKPLDLVTCMDQIQQMTERARFFYEEKENAFEQANMNQQILLNELQKRESVIEQLHKIRLEEKERKDGEIYRLERELHLMGSVLDGYRKALKETQKAFDKYREKARLIEESTYKDVGPGGLMMSSSDIERLRKKQEEEFKMNCLIIEEKIKGVEAGCVAQFGAFFERINILENKLIGVEADGKELFELFKQRKVPRIDEEVPEVEEPREIMQTKEKMGELEEHELIAQTGGEVIEETEHQVIQQVEEKVHEVVAETYV